LDCRETGDRSDREKPVLEESALAAPVSMTFRKLPLLSASHWAKVFMWISPLLSAKPRQRSKRDMVLPGRTEAAAVADVYRGESANPAPAFE